MTNFIRHVFVKDAMLKVFSLVLAIMIWLALSAIQRDATPAVGPLLHPGQLTFFNIEVGVLSSASDVRSYQVEPKTVEVTVEGDSKILQRLESKDVRAMVDLTGYEGTGEIRKRIEVSAPAGVKHVRVSPSEARIIFPSQH
jgi:YbbR domain-containing protein